jgi:hypothetical protein
MPTPVDCEPGDIRADLRLWAIGWSQARGLPTPTFLTADLVRIDRDVDRGRTEFLTLRPDLPAAVVHAAVRGSGGIPGLVSLTMPIRDSSQLGRITADYRRLGWLVAVAHEYLLTSAQLHPTGFLGRPGYVVNPSADPTPGPSLAIHIETVDETPAATGLMWLGSPEPGREPTAVIARIATEPDHRRRGLAAALVQILAAEAARRGHHRALVIAPNAGRLVAHRAGWHTTAEFLVATLPRPG